MTPQHFLLIADALPEALVLLSGDGGILAGNTAARDLLGIDPRGRHLAELATDPPDEVARYLRLCARSRHPVLGAIAPRGSAGTVACRAFGNLVSPKTAETDALLLLRLLPNRAAAEQFVVLNRRIEDLETEVRRRKQAEEAAGRQEERLRVTLLSIGDAVIASDAAGRVTHLNAVAESLTGWTTADAAGQPLDTVFRIVNESTRRPVENPAERALRDGVIVGLTNHTILIARDGTERPIDDSAAPIRGADGEIVGCVLVFRDISDRKRTEAELERSAAESERQRRLYETVLTNTPDLAYVFDLNHRFTYANHALLTMWGKSWEEAVGKTCLELGYEPWHAAMHDREIEQVVATRRPIRGEVAFDGTNGRRQYDYIFVPVVGADGEVEAVAGTTRDVTDRREAERAIRVGEERLRTALSAARMVAWEWTPADGELQVSENAADVFGLPAGVGLTGIDQGLALLHPDDVAAYRATFQRAIDERGSYRTRYRLIRPDDGRVVWIEERGHAVFDQPGGGVRLYGVAGDVTDRHEAEVERERLLRQVEAERGRLADVFRQAPAFLCVLRGADHVYELANDQYFQLVGHRPLLGRPVRQALPEVEDQGFVELLDGVYRTGETFVGADVRVLLARQSGQPTEERYVDFVYQALRDPDGAVSGIVTVGVDVTARHRAEADFARLHAEAERERRLFAAVLSSTPDFIYTFDLDGRFVYVNAALLALWGKRLDEAVGRNFFDLDYPPALADRLQRQIQQVITTGQPVRDETPYTGLAGEREYEYIFVPVLGAGGAVEAVAGSTRDITDRKRSEEELRRLAADLSDADRRKDEFLATLAHELRNPLAPIRNGLQVIKMVGADATVEQARSMMDRQLTQLVRLVDDLLDVSRITRGKLDLRTERVGMRTVIAAAVETARPAIERAGHALAIDVPDEPVFVDGDVARLAQVVSNLLTNSAKYTRRGGHIRLALWRDGDAVVVSVADDGIGIPPAMLERVFVMFTQVDRSLEKTTGGLGIGLSLVKGLVEMHGGTVEARSEGEGKGSEFVVRLPIVMPANSDAVNEPVEVAVTSGRRRILVVDDNTDAADSLGQLLEMLGNEVRTAHDGEAGVATAAAFRPDLVFLDLGMPKVNGFEACRRIREQSWGKRVTLVALTGWGQEDDRRKTAEAGFDHHLVKPVEYAALVTLLRPNERG